MPGQAGRRYRRLPRPLVGALGVASLLLVADLPWYVGALLDGGPMSVRAYLHNALLLVLVVAFAVLVVTDRRLDSSRTLWLLGTIVVTVPVWLAYLWVYEVRRVGGGGR